MVVHWNRLSGKVRRLASYIPLDHTSEKSRTWRLKIALATGPGFAAEARQRRDPFKSHASESTSENPGVWS